MFVCCIYYHLELFILFVWCTIVSNKMFTWTASHWNVITIHFVLFWCNFCTVNINCITLQCSMKIWIWSNYCGIGYPSGLSFQQPAVRFHACEIGLTVGVSANRSNWIVFCFRLQQCHLSMQLHIAATWFLFCSLQKIIHYIKIDFPAAVTFGRLWNKICSTICTLSATGTSVAIWALKCSYSEM